MQQHLCWVRRCDILSLHCPATPQTRGLVNAEALAKMKPGAILLNTARGALVDEEAVAAALHSGQLGFYGADAFVTEPLPQESPLFLSPFFSPRHSLNKFGSVHGLAKTFSLIVRRTAVRSYPTQGYALFARVRMHPSPAMDGDAIQRRIVPKVIPGR